MRHHARVVGLFLAVLSGVACGGSDDATVRRSMSQMAEEAAVDSIGTLTLLPSGARVDAQHDPDNIAPGMVSSRMRRAFQERWPQGVVRTEAVIDDRGLNDALQEFYRQWLKDPEGGDDDRVQRIALRLQAQTLLVSGVTRWEQSDRYARVGMMAGLFDGETGRLLWWTEQERQANAPAGDGPPDYIGVVDSVVDALLEAVAALEAGNR